MRLAREAWPFVSLWIALAAALAVWSGWAALVPGALLVFTLWFFRDPERKPPEDPAAFVSPADGRVIRASPGALSVFLNVFDVHVCRSPASGRVASVTHVRGRFLAAFKDDASEHNERTRIVLDTASGAIEVTLVAGLIARRIVCKVSAGQPLAAGERIGLIRFGSRVDVRLPDGAGLDVRVGDRVVAGETVVARARAAFGSRQQDPL